VHTTLTAKMQIHPRKRARSTVQHTFAMQTIATYPATWTLRTKPPDSTTAYGAAAVTAALPHRYHLIIRHEASPIQFLHCLKNRAKNGENEFFHW